MIDDRLAAATRALKRTSEESDSDSARTRARVMMSLHQRRFRRTRRTAWLVPFGILVAASSAWAGSDGRVTAWLRTASERFEPGVSNPTENIVAVQPRRAAPRAKAVARAEHDVRVPPPAVEASASKPVKEHVIASPTAAKTMRPVTAKPRRPAPADKVAAMPSPDDPGFDAYRTAHRAHFSQRNPAAALPAWDAYLREAPSGRFTSEARYNRALCLVRLGRHAEARAALTPFARGDYGKYRQREASALLGALE